MPTLNRLVDGPRSARSSAPSTSTWARSGDRKRTCAGTCAWTRRASCGSERASTFRPSIRCRQWLSGIGGDSNNEYYHVKQEQEREREQEQEREREQEREQERELELEQELERELELELEQELERERELEQMIVMNIAMLSGSRSGCHVKLLFDLKGRL